MSRLIDTDALISSNDLIDIGKQLAEGFYEGLKHTDKTITAAVKKALEEGIPKETILEIAGAKFGFAIAIKEEVHDEVN